MGILVYYFDPAGSQAHYTSFTDSEFTAVTKTVEALRKSGMVHVCISSEPENMVGNFGVTAVENGKTPDGQIYDWRKRR